MLRNMILGPVFNINFDQFLTLEFCYVFVFCCFLGGLKPLVIVFTAKSKILRNTKKKKDTICEHNKCANCSCQNVCSFLHF